MYFSVYSQQTETTTADSIPEKNIEEVIVIGKTNTSNKQTKALSSLDSYLESNPLINMVRRGAYAWEALLNGMATERSVITIDGMRIFGACTDKMDPITSYVETTNLDRATIQSGQSGSKHGATIAGSINLERSHSSFDSNGFKGTVFTGFESNNIQKIAGGKIQYAGRKFYFDSDYTLRDALNYKAGRHQEILYSQFRKQNMSANLGILLNSKNSIQLSTIYDRATNVGYPALPMDVSLAEAVISSITHEYHNPEKNLSHWETKLYYNQIKHIMDDSKRPIVPIRMDMPGWTKTAGFYTIAHIHAKKHHIQTGANGYFNYAMANMTMYPNNPNEKSMYMITWPGVATVSTNIHLEDEISWTKNWSTKISAGTGISHSIITDSLGIESLSIFYPKLSPTKTRFVSNGGLKAGYEKNRKSIYLGIAYSERVPTVSEAYGYYLFNSYDRYDYLGNPNLLNEKAVELSLDASYAISKFIMRGTVTYFHMMNYIIGSVNTDYYQMTIGAYGVKVYEQFPTASIFNSSISANYFVAKGLSVSAKAVYRSGTSGKVNLPFIQPFSYGCTIKYDIKGYQLEATIEGAAKQLKFSPTFGETQAKAYTLLHAGFSKTFYLNAHQLVLKTGVENILDRVYSTFADWNKIPRMGRNFYINIIYQFQAKRKASNFKKTTNKV